MYLRISAIRKDNDGNTIVKSGTIRPAIINARIFPRFQLSFLIEHTVVEETTELMVSDEGCQTYQYLQRCHRYGKSVGFENVDSTFDLILHDACKAVSQNVFTTTEIAKFKMSRDAPYDILYVILIS
jgi:hypothetical protein